MLFYTFSRCLASLIPDLLSRRLRSFGVFRHLPSSRTVRESNRARVRRINRYTFRRTVVPAARRFLHRFNVDAPSQSPDTNTKREPLRFTKRATNRQQSPTQKMSDFPKKFFAMLARKKIHPGGDSCLHEELRC